MKQQGVLGVAHRVLPTYLLAHAVQVHPPDISFRDFEKVMLRARPTVSKDDLGIFEKYKNEFGASRCI